MTNDATQPGRTPDGAQSFSSDEARANLMMKAASKSLYGAIVRANSWNGAPDFKRAEQLVYRSVGQIICAAELTIAGRLREGAVRYQGYGDDHSLIGQVLEEIAGVIAPQLPEIQPQQE